MNRPANKSKRKISASNVKDEVETKPGFLRQAISDRKLRIAVIGAGLMGKWHARIAEKAGGQIIGIVDTDIENARQLAKNFQGAKAFGNLQELLDTVEVDALHICTPSPSHYQIAETALKRNINLFIEKPLAQTADETIELYHLSEEKNVVICPAHQFVFQQCAKNARKRLALLGKIIHLESVICSAGAGGTADNSSDLIAADILPHPLSLFQFFSGAEQLPEEKWDILHSNKGEIRLFSRKEFTTFSIFISMNIRPTVNTFRIYGTKGTIHLDFFHDFAVFETGVVSRTRKIFRPFGFAVGTFQAAAFNLMRRIVQFEPAYPGLYRLISDFYEAIRTGISPPISSRQAINIARIRDRVVLETNSLANKL